MSMCSKTSRIRELSSSTKREIIVIMLILIASIALSIPQYIDDCKTAAAQKNEQRMNKAPSDIGNTCR